MSFVLLVLPGLAHHAAAQASWIGANNGDWFTAANWDTNSVPNSATAVSVANNTTALISGQPAAAFGVTLGTTVGAGGLTVGTGGSLTTSSTISIGSDFEGTLTVSGGGTVSAGTLTTQAFTGPEGTVLVTGAGSTLSASLYAIGTALGASTATITVGDGGLFDLTGPIAFSTSTNTSINLNGTAGSRGVLATAYIDRVSAGGSVLLNFDGGVLRANADSSNFLAGSFSAGDVTLLAGGGFIDTNNHAITINAVIDGAGALTKQGTGTLTLAGANTYTGGTRITGGTLSVSANNNLGGAGSVTFDGATLETTAGFTMNRAVSLTGTGVINTTSGTLIASGVVSGAGALTKTGAGTLELAGNNTFIGGVTLQQGTLEIGNNNGLGSGTLTVNGGTLSTDGSARSINNAIVANTDFSIYPRGTLVNVSSFRLGGSLDLGGTLRTITNPSDFSNGDFGEVRFDGVISNGSVYFNTIPGNAAAFFSMQGSQSNTYTGLTQIGTGVSLQLLRTINVTSIPGDLTIESDGVVVVDSGEQIANSATVTIQGPLGRLQIGAFTDATETIGDLQGTGEVALKDSDNGGSIQLLAGNFGGAITGGVAANNTSLIKSGIGTLTLSGNSTYVGGTQVLGGTLILDGSLGNTDVIIGVMGTLRGSGSISGSLSASTGAVIAPGNSPGVLTVGELFLSNTTQLNFELGTSSDRMDVVTNLNGLGSNGNLTLDGILNITDSGGFGEGSYRLFNYGGTLTNNTLSFGVVPGGYDLTIETAVANQVNLNVAPVTEQYWDGENTTDNDVVDGGDGDWDNEATNWTNSNGTLNDAWAEQGAVFSGSAGNVNVTDDVNFRSLRFVTDGYILDGTGALQAVDNAAIIAEAGVTAQIHNAITGDADDTLEIRGGGEVILYGTNTYGGGTLLSAGTLGIENDQALGTGDLFVSSGSTIATEDGFAISNRMILQGDASIISFEDLAEFRGETILGDAVRSLNVVGPVEFEGAITGGSDSGLQLTSSGSALVSFTGLANNSFGSLRVGNNVFLSLLKASGGVSVSGDLQIDAGGSVLVTDLGSTQIAASSNVTLNGTLQYDGFISTVVQTFASLRGSGTLINGNPDGIGQELNLTILSGSFAGAIQEEEDAGAITLIKDGDGRLTLSGNNTYSGLTIVNGGTLIADSDTAISNTLAVIGGKGAVLQINPGVTLGNEIDIKDSGQLVNFGTYNAPAPIQTSGGGGVVNRTGGTINGSVAAVSDSFVSLFDGSRFNGDIAFGQTDSVLVLNGSGDEALDAALNGQVSGSYGLLKTGAGNWTIDRELSPSRGTIIDEGSLTVGNGGDLKSSVTNYGELIFDKGRGNYVFAGNISGPGDLVQDGASNTILTGELTYTGTTYVNNGGLILGTPQHKSSLAGDVIVQEGAFFGGAGSIDGDFTSAGIVSPGYSPGALNIQGKFTLRSTALLVIEVASATSYDKLTIGGKAKLGGTLRIVLLNGYEPQPGTEFDILKAKSLDGVFASLDASAMWQLVYGSKSLELVFGGREPYQFYAESPNQYNVGLALEDLRTDGTSSDFNRNIRPVLDALTPKELRQAFDAIAPNQSIAFSAALFARSKTWLPQMAGRLADIRAGSTGFVSSGLNVRGAADMKDVLAPAPDNKWGVWVDGAGVFNEVAGFARLGNGDGTGAAGTVGADYRFCDSFIAGLYTGYVGAWTDFGNGSEVNSNGSRFGIYSTYQTGGFYLNHVIGGEWNGYDWKRRIAFPGIDRTANADTEGTVFETMFGGGYDWKFGNLSAGFFGGLEYTLLFVDGFTEQGAGALDLRIKDQDADSLRTNVGGQVMYELPLAGLTFRPSARVAWRHEYLDGSRRVNSALVGGAGPGFGINLPATDRRDSLLVNAGCGLGVTENLSVYTYYTGDIAGQVGDIHAVNAGVRFEF